MGLILDTSVLVSAERQKAQRRGYPCAYSYRLWRDGLRHFGSDDLRTGACPRGAKLAGHRQRHRAFLDDVKVAITIYPFTVEIAERAGETAGQLAAQVYTYLMRIC